MNPALACKSLAYLCVNLNNSSYLAIKYRRLQVMNSVSNSILSSTRVNSNRSLRFVSTQNSLCYKTLSSIQWHHDVYNYFTWEAAKRWWTRKRSKQMWRSVWGSLIWRLCVTVFDLLIFGPVVTFLKFSQRPCNNSSSYSYFWRNVPTVQSLLPSVVFNKHFHSYLLRVSSANDYLASSIVESNPSSPAGYCIGCRIICTRDKNSKVHTQKKNAKAYTEKNV